jgi:hypothetical protein
LIGGGVGGGHNGAGAGQVDCAFPLGVQGGPSPGGAGSRPAMPVYVPTEPDFPYDLETDVSCCEQAEGPTGFGGARPSEGGFVACCSDNIVGGGLKLTPCVGKGYKNANPMIKNCILLHEYLHSKQGHSECNLGEGVEAWWDPSIPLPPFELVPTWTEMNCLEWYKQNVASSSEKQEIAQRQKILFKYYLDNLIKTL